MRFWSTEHGVLTFAILIVSVCDLVHGQVVDVLPDIPTGAVSVRVKVLSTALPVEHVQTNPVGFTQIVGPIDLAGVPNTEAPNAGAPNAGAPNDSGYLAIANYGGKVSLFDSSGVEFATPLLDLNNPLSPSHNPDFSIGQAHGLSAIAFHPSFTDDTSAGYKSSIRWKRNLLRPVCRTLEATTFRLFDRVLITMMSSTNTRCLA
jgi:hypothetical protein